MINFFKKLFKISRRVLMIDDRNLTAYFITSCYPESGAIFLRYENDNKVILLLIDSFSKHKQMYTVQSSQGNFIIKYL